MAMIATAGTIADELLYMKDLEGKQYWSDAFNKAKTDYEANIKDLTEAYKGNVKNLSETYQGNVEDVKRNYGSQVDYLKSQQRNLAQQSYIAKQTYDEDLASAASKAYDSYMSQRSDILGSNIGQGYKEKYLSDIDLALQDAYKQNAKIIQQNKASIDKSVLSSYNTMTNKISSLSESTNRTLQNLYSDYVKEQKSAYSDYTKQHEALGKEFTKQYEALSKELTSEAENYEKLTNYTRDYLKYLYDFYFDVENNISAEDNPFISNPDMAKYVRQRVGANGPEEGMYDLITNEELSALMFDEEGNLTEFGTNFYDQMLNYNASKIGERTDISVQNFGDYLYSKDKKLSDFLRGTEYFNINEKQEYSTKLNTFKKMVGLDPNDIEYSWLERKGGMSDKQIESIFTDYTKLANSLNAVSSKKDYENFTTTLKTSVNDLESLTKSLGLNIDFSKLNETIDASNTAIKNNDADFWSRFGEEAGEVALYTVSGAAIGSVGGGVGAGVGAAVGAIIGLVSTMTKEILYQQGKPTTEQLREGYSKDLAKLYQDLVKAVIEEAKSRDTNK